MELELFTVADCPRCRLAKSLLDQADLSYVEVDAAAGMAPLRRLRRLSGGAQVPILALGDEAWPALTPGQAKEAVARLAARLNPNRIPNETDHD